MGEKNDPQILKEHICSNLDVLTSEHLGRFREQVGGASAHFLASGRVGNDDCVGADHPLQRRGPTLT